MEALLSALAALLLAAVPLLLAWVEKRVEASPREVRRASLDAELRDTTKALAANDARALAAVWARRTRRLRLRGVSPPSRDRARDRDGIDGRDPALR